MRTGKALAKVSNPFAVRRDSHGHFFYWLKRQDSNASFIPVQIGRNEPVPEERGKELVLSIGSMVRISGRISSKELAQWIKELHHACATIC